MDRQQVNVRLSPELVEAIDKKRIELQPAMGKIPTRSEVVRYALDQFLLGQGSLGPTSKGPANRRSNSK